MYVLLVESRFEDQATILAILTELGMRVDVVNSGAYAFVMAGLHRYDVILMDLHLPGMEAIATIRKIRRLAAGGQTPIISITDRLMNGTLTFAKCSEMDGYLFKPIDSIELINMLWRILQCPKTLEDPLCSTDGFHELTILGG
ncbi:response regulator [Paenibacillus silvisoli]|uniref:response regulator n=1 Tax=Paenibacillus silvisoli TaxID=3110539 RepID=UPI002805122D|nr:response regulator [Paenibacillus silvisoli]